MFVQPFYFVSYYFSWIEYDYFFFHFQETYNSWLREKYEDDPSTHPNFDLDLWMEVWSSGGPDKNQVYGLSNTTAKNLRAARSISTIGSSQSVSSTQSEEFIALKQQYAQLSANYNTSTTWSWTLDQRWVMIHVCLFFGRFVPGTTSLHHLLLLLPLRHCSSLIFFWKHIKFVMNII